MPQHSTASKHCAFFSVVDRSPTSFSKPGFFIHALDERDQMEEVQSTGGSSTYVDQNKSNHRSVIPVTFVIKAAEKIPGLTEGMPDFMLAPSEKGTSSAQDERSQLGFYLVRSTSLKAARTRRPSIRRCSVQRTAICGIVLLKARNILTISKKSSAKRRPVVDNSGFSLSA